MIAALPQLRQFHASAACCKVQSGRYKITQKRDKPLTYEMANPPHFIAHRKSWNSWDTSMTIPECYPDYTFDQSFMLLQLHSRMV